jgi:uncharacterized hydrophobic protein (TIGR00341 family)
MKLIKANFPSDKLDQVVTAINNEDPIDWSFDNSFGDTLKAVEIVVDDGRGQSAIEVLETIFLGVSDWRITVIPLEATLPRPEANGDDRDFKTETIQEKLYQTVSDGCRLNADFIVLTLLSAIVAVIGLNYDNVAVVIAAMVIAPLLGPILAFSLGAALGDSKLIRQAAKTSFFGFGIGFLSALLIALFMPVNPESTQLMDRTILGPEIVILALASGAAAALSLSTGVSSALVGVMVAVALLPPSVAAALFLGAGQFEQAASAAILLGLNVVCVLLAAQAVFVWKRVRPQTWHARQRAATSVKINTVIWGLLLIALLVLTTRLAT